MGKTLGYGEITVANMTEPFTVMLTNEAQQFATDSNRKVTSAQSYYTDIIVIRGSQERTDYTIGNITSGSGITVSKSSKRVTFSVSAGTTIGADTGVIEIPITLDGQTVKKQFSWSCGKQGPQGVKGEDGSNFAWNLLKGTGTAKEFTPKGNLTNQTTLFNKLDLSGQTLKEGDKFVISCDLEWTQFTQGTSGTFDYWFQGSVDYSWSYDNIFTQGLQKVQPTKAEILASDGKKHLSAVCTMKQSLLDKKIFEIGIGFDNTDGTGKIKISNLKIAKEDKESPWCLHPDELKGATGDKGKSVQSVIEYYLATSASTGVTTSTSGWSTDPTTQKLTAEKKYLWNCKQTVYDDGTRGSITSPVICGTYGDKGQNAKNLSITPSSQYFKSTDGGKTFAPNAITIKPTIQGEISFGKWQYSIDGGVSFADVMSGQKGLMISNNVLTVSKDSSLYSDAVTMVTFRAVANDSSFYDTCSIAKIYDVSDIGDGRNLLWNSNFAKTDEVINTSTYTTWGLILRGRTYTATIDTSVKHNNFNTLKVIGTKAGENGGQDLIYRIKGLNLDEVKFTEIDVKYTLSFYAKASIACNFSARYAYDSYAKDTNVALSTDWKRYEIQMHPTTTSYQTTLIFKMDAASTVWFSEFKLEKGSSATGYSTAPEDFQTTILSTKSEISDVSLKVDNNKQAIEQRVTKTTYEQDLTLVKGDISKANEGLNKWRYEIYPKSLFTDKPEDQSKYDIGVFIRNKNLTPSHTLVFDDNKWTLLDYENNYIGYGLTFVKMSAKKTFSTKWAHSSSCSIYVNGKLIISDKGTVRLDSNNTGRDFSCTFIEGWNCIEFVMQETTGNEWFFFKDAISAISECQLMNCYYGTPVARQSHITNQLVQNTTDIDGVSGSVQQVMSTVGGSGKVDEFVNNYSTWKKKVDGIENRVGETYTTKSDFNGLEIGGRNLARDTSNEYSTPYTNFNGSTNTCFYDKRVYLNGLKAGDTITVHMYVKYDDIVPTSGQTARMWTQGSGNVTVWNSGTFPASSGQSLSGSGVCEILYSATVYKDSEKNQYWKCCIRTDYIQSGSMQIKSFKVEKGNKPTDWTPAPEDDEINGQNLVSNLPSNWEQGTVTEGSAIGTTYANTKSSSAGSIRPKELIPVSGDITISIAYSNQSKKPIRHWIAAYDVNKNYLGNNYVSNAWNSFPRTLDMKDAKYIAIMVGYTDSSAITPSDISQICLKIERGTSATPFTLAPEDVNGKIVNVETIANQTANKFEWIVKGGDSSSNFTLTDRVADLVAERINFNGLVKFSGLNTDAKNEIGKVAQSKVDGLEVGGRNLLKHSSMIGEKLVCDNYVGCNGCDTKEYTNEGFHIITPTKGNANNGIAFSFDNFTILGINGGDTITFSCDIKGTSDSHAPFVSIHISDNNWYGSDVIQQNTGVSITKDWQRVSVTITTPTGLTKNHMWLAIHGNYQSDLYVRNFKLEKGNKATDWTPALEDVSQDATNKASQALTDAKNYSSNAVKWVTNNGSSTTSLNSMVKKWTDGAVSDTAQINGGWIKANTITANKIAIGDFTNYADDPDFENGLYSPTGTFSLSTEQKYVGTKSLKMASGTVAYRGTTISPEFYLEKDEEIYVEYYVYRNGANHSAGVCIGASTSNYGSAVYDISGQKMASANITDKTWTKISYVGKANRSGMWYASFKHGSDTTLTGDWYLDHVTIRKRATGNLIVDGSITADKIATDAIKSRNYISSGGTQGSFLNLSDGSFTSPNLSWDSNGNLIASNANLSGLINATKGTVGGWNIATNGLYSGIDENAIKIYSATTYDAQTMYQKQKIQDSFILSQKYINHFVSQQVSVGHNIPYWQTRSFIYNDSQIQLAQSDYCINTSSASNYDAQYSLKDGYISATRIYMEQNITQVGGDVINSSFSIGLDSMMGWCSIQSTKGINIYGNSSRALYVQSNDTSKYNALETEGDVVVNGKIHAVSGDNKIQLNSDNNGSIELYGNTPFIDFHSAYSSADYTCRIIANTPEQLLVCGKLRCDSNIISNNDLIANSWVYAGQNAHYTWQNQLDCYFSCGYYNNTNNVYYYAGYHAFYVNNDSGSGMMYINTNGVTSRVGFTKTSDERIKKNFESFDDNIIDAYMNIEPVKYQLKQSSNDNYHFGFKAQHVDKVFSDYGDTYNESFDICTSRPIDPDKAKELYGVDDMTEEYGLRYDELIAPTTYMVQHIYKELESTKGELAKVKQEKADLETRLQAIEAKLRL